MYSHEIEASDACVCVASVDAELVELVSNWAVKEARASRHFSTAQEFLEWFDGTVPVSLVLDLNLEERGGLELQQELAQIDRSVQIIFATARASVHESIMAMRHGAMDFFVRPYSNTELLARIEEATEMAARQHELMRSYLCLTSRERQVLLLLVENMGSLTAKQIAREIGLSPRTIEHYRTSLLVKMRAGSVTELVLRAQQVLDAVQPARTPAPVAQCDCAHG